MKIDRTRKKKLAEVEIGRSRPRSRGGGQNSQKDGHTGSSEWMTEGGGDEEGRDGTDLQVGKVMKGTETRGPDCDRISVRSVEAIVGNKRSTSTQAAATLCHPNDGMPSS